MRNLGLMLPEMLHVGAKSSEPVQDQAILQLAHATIGLSQVAPQVSEMASERQAEAEKQAVQVHEIANMVQDMTSTLTQTVGQLRESTGEIVELTALIKRIADQTRMIAINAGIAAAHAGVQGRVFTVLANEIRSLSETAAAATKDVQVKIERLQESTLLTSRTVGLEEGSSLVSSKDNNRGLAWLLDRMNEADASATRQAKEARDLNHLGLSLRSLSEEMIHSIGSFRLAVHEQVEQLIENLRSDRELISGDPRWQITALRQVVKRYPFVELAYITDARGIQTIENISRDDFQAAYGDSGKHKNWSQRSWYTGAMNTSGVYLSEIYRSQATDEFCLTASATFNDQYGRMAGVVAIDVNFREILGENKLNN